MPTDMRSDLGASSGSDICMALDLRRSILTELSSPTCENNEDIEILASREGISNY